MPSSFAKISRWKLFDLGSINGTAVNGEPIIGGKAKWLEDGDRIAFGGTLSQFRTGFPHLRRNRADCLISPLGEKPARDQT